MFFSVRDEKSCPQKPSSTWFPFPGCRSAALVGSQSISTLCEEVGSCGPNERFGLSREEGAATGLADGPCGSSDPVVPVQFGGGWVFHGFGPRKVKVFFGFCD